MIILKLSAALLAYYLKKKYNVECSDNLSAEPLLRYPVISHQPGPDRTGIVYIVDSGDYQLPNHLIRHAMIIFTNVCEQDQTAGHPNVCMLKNDVPADDVFLYVQEIFDLYSAWEDELTQSRLSGRPIQDLIDITARRIISNPILLIGMDFTVIATRGTSYGELRNSVLGTNEVTYDLVTALKSDPNYADTFSRDGCFVYPGNRIASPMLCVNIKRFQNTVFRLLVSRGEIPIDLTFGFVLEALSNYISHAFSTNTVVNRDTSSSLHQIFRAILTDPAADYIEVSQQLSNLGWYASHSYQCILIEPGALDGRNLSLRSICSYIESTIPGSCSIEYRGNAIVYVNIDLCPLSDSEIAQRLAGFIRDSMLNAGYSRKMTGHFNLQRQYVQASLALTVGRRKSPSQWIHHFNEITLVYMLDQTTRKLPPYMLAHEKLLQLKNMADNNDSPLYQTLRVYLENHQNLTKTSEDLFIHRSTLLYRLEKIQNLMHCNFDNPEEVLYLLLSFRILDQEKDARQGSSAGVQS